MCGIVAILAKGERRVPDLKGRLAAMAEVLAHRGPDDAGVYVAADERVGLANRRLAIRDLSAAGHMPMGSRDGSVWITYNGEVYNAAELRRELEGCGYCFRSQSDTEVILHGYRAWGQAVVERLRGMFAFVILEQGPDGAGGCYRLLLARDRLGIKPLYYAQTAEALVVASELKGVLASGLVGGQVQGAAVAGYLLLGSVPAPLTIYEGVKALPPASLMLVNCDRPEEAAPQRYWQLPMGTREPDRPAAVVAAVRAAMAEAVRVRLVSDVPLGAFLSGGLDSSSVVAFMRQATAGPIRTCSMSFAEAEYDEAGYARAVAERLGTEHQERVVSAGEVMAGLDDIFEAMGQPTIDGVNSYFVSQTARQAGLTVALSGLGGDELFGGYANTFEGVPRTLGHLRLAHGVPGIGPALGRAAVRLFTRERRWLKISDALGRAPSPGSAYLAQRGLFAPSEVRALLPREMGAMVGEVAAQVGQAAGDGGADLFGWVSRAELGHYTADQLLRDTDVMSMAHSLEVRVPLLDERLVELVLQLPRAYKVNGGCLKPLLQQAAGELLPELVRERGHKQGFTFPFDRWLRGPLRPLLAEPMGAAADWLAPAVVQAVYRGFEAGRVHWSRAWALAVLNGWLQRVGEAG